MAGESRDLRLTNYVVEYGKLVTDGRPEGAQFVLFTSPSVTVADREANPFAQFDDGELLEEIVGRAEGSATDVRETGRRSSQVLDSSVVFRVYEATTMVEGQAIPLLIHFGRTSHDGDLLGVLGVYPGLLDESESIYELASATVHPAEFDS